MFSAWVEAALFSLSICRTRSNASAAAGQIVDLLFPDVADLEQLRDLVAGILEDLDPLLDDVDGVFPARLLHEQVFEGLERPEVLLVVLDDLAPRLDGARSAA